MRIPTLNPSKMRKKMRAFLVKAYLQTRISCAWTVTSVVRQLLQLGSSTYINFVICFMWLSHAQDWRLGWRSPQSRSTTAPDQISRTWYMVVTWLVRVSRQQEYGDCLGRQTMSTSKGKCTKTCKRMKITANRSRVLHGRVRRCLVWWLDSF